MEQGTTELDRRQQFLIRRAALTTERESWITQYRELSKYVMPRTGRFLLTDRNKGQTRHNAIIDSTGSRALRVLAAGLMAGMTSPARPWFRLETADAALNEKANVKAWLNDCTKKMRTVFARSNTYRALHSMYEELGLYGTSASIMLEDFDDVLRHYPTTAGEYMITSDWRGEVCGLYREFQMTVSSIVKEFGRDNCSKGVLSMYDGGRNLDAWVSVMHVIEPRADRDTKSKLAKDMPFTSNYLEIASNEPKFLRESGFKRFPALCPRWATSGGDIYGNSPGQEALGDIKQLQHGQLRKAQAIDYMVRPPIQVPAAMKNMPLATLPGGVIHVDQTGPHNGIRSAWDVRMDISGQLEDIRDVRHRIEQTFYVDLFLMLAQADQRGSPVTAREVAEKHEEKLLMLGPVLERLHNEMLKPMIDVAFDRMIEAGMVPPPPEELHGMDLNVEFVSMLAQAQRAIGLGGVDRLVSTIGQIAVLQGKAGVQPDILDKLNVDEVVDQYADMLGVDANLIVADEQVAIVRANRAKQQQAAQQAQMMPAAAAAAKDLGQAGPAGEQAVGDIISNFSGYTGPGAAMAA